MQTKVHKMAENSEILKAISNLPKKIYILVEQIGNQLFSLEVSGDTQSFCQTDPDSFLGPQNCQNWFNQFPKQQQRLLLNATSECRLSPYYRPQLYLNLTSEETQITCLATLSLVDAEKNHFLIEASRAEAAPAYQNFIQTECSLFKIVKDALPHMVFWKDTQSKYQGANHAFLSAINLQDEEQIIGKTDFDLAWPQETAEKNLIDDRQVIESGLPKYNIIETFADDEQGKRCVITNKIPLQDHTGRTIGLLGTVEDVTKLVNALSTTYNQLLESSRIDENQLKLLDQLKSLQTDSSTNVHHEKSSMDNGAHQLSLEKLKTKQALLVEDSVTNQLVGKAFIQKLGLKTDVAEDGLIAFNKCLDTQYDVILMDLQMPVMDGLTATRKIRKLAGYANIPILAMTGMTSDIDRQATLEAGMNGHISKPINEEELIKVLVSALVTKDTQPQALSANHFFKPSSFNLNSLKEKFNQDLVFLSSILNAFYVDLQQTQQTLTAPSLTIDEIREVLHKLKGSAGNLGHMTLYEKIKAEESLTEKNNFVVSPSLIAMINETLAATQQIISTLSIRKMEPSAIPISKKELTTLLNDIEERLSQNRLIPQNSLERLKNAYPNNEILHTFFKYLDSFDYPLATSTLSAFRGQCYD